MWQYNPNNPSGAMSAPQDASIFDALMRQRGAPNFNSGNSGGGLLGNSTQMRGLMDRLASPMSQLGAMILANSGGNLAPVGQAIAQYGAMQREGEANRLRDEYLRAQIERMRTPDQAQRKLVPVVRDGKIVYEYEDAAAGLEVPQEQRGPTADSAMIQEWRASGVPDYMTFLRMRSRAMQQTPAEPLIAVQNGDGQSVLLPRSQAAGRAPAAPREGALPTEGERVSANYLGRMQAAEARLGDYRPSITDYAAATSAMRGGAIRGSVSNAMLSPEGQSYYQAAADWVRAKLRRESGAVIAPEEMEQEIKTYFPVPGDSQAVVEQKRQARLQAMSGMQQMSGRARQPVWIEGRDTPRETAAPSGRVLRFDANGNPLP